MDVNININVDGAGNTTVKQEKPKVKVKKRKLKNGVESIIELPDAVENTNVKNNNILDMMGM